MRAIQPSFVASKGMQSHGNCRMDLPPIQQQQYIRTCPNFRRLASTELAGGIMISLRKPQKTEGLRFARSFSMDVHCKKAMWCVWWDISEIICWEIILNGVYYWLDSDDERQQWRIPDKKGKRQFNINSDRDEKTVLKESYHLSPRYTKRVLWAKGIAFCNLVVSLWQSPTGIPWPQTSIVPSFSICELSLYFKYVWLRLWIKLFTYFYLFPLPFSRVHVIFSNWFYIKTLIFISILMKKINTALSTWVYRTVFSIKFTNLFTY